VKPENFLFLSKSKIEKNLLKLIDFGVARRFESGVAMTSKTGTSYYAAPEVLLGNYSHQVDIWSCGVILYIALCGHPPFEGLTDAEVLRKVQKGTFEFEPQEWRQVSKDAIRLIKHMMRRDPEKRFTAEQSLNDSWIANLAPTAKGKNIGSKVISGLQKFRNENRLKKLALHVIAEQADETKMGKLREIFVALDDNGDGRLTLVEMKEGLEQAGFDEIPADFKQLVEQVDVDGSGGIDYTEFLAATLDQEYYLDEAVCWRAFKTFDLDGNGVIDQEELRAMLKTDSVQDAVDNKVIAELLQNADTNGDGEIDFQEFLELMRSATQTVADSSADDDGFMSDGV